SHMVKLGWSRKYINRAISFIRGCWKWGVRKELIPVEWHQRLCSVPGLEKGKTEAPEPKPVEDVPDEIVQKTLPFLPKPVAGLVMFQRLTGARPGEAVLLRPCDIDQKAFVVDGIPVWVYLPEKHKGEWKDLWRALPLGPRCQKMLAEFLTREPESYCFSPKECGRPSPRHKDRYRIDSYDHAIYRACERAKVE